MLSFIQNQIIFYIALIVVLFLPGYFFLLAVFGRKGRLGLLERFVIASGLSIIIVDFLMLLLGRIHILISRASLLVSIFIFILVCYAIYKVFRKNSVRKDEVLFNFSSKQLLLAVLLIFLTFIIKLDYLKDKDVARYRAVITRLGIRK